jgi:hypothetical protein
MERYVIRISTTVAAVTTKRKKKRLKKVKRQKRRVTMIDEVARPEEVAA